MEIAGEMKVDVGHRHHLGVAAAGGAALHAEARTERRFAQADHRLAADPVERVAEPDGGGGLALAGGRRGHRRHQDQPAVGPLRERLDIGQRNLGLEMPERLERFQRNAEPLLGQRHDRPHMRRPRDIDIAFRLLVKRRRRCFHRARGLRLAHRLRIVHRTCPRHCSNSLVHKCQTIAKATATGTMQRNHARRCPKTDTLSSARAMPASTGPPRALEHARSMGLSLFIFGFPLAKAPSFHKPPSFDKLGNLVGV